MKRRFSILILLILLSIRISLVAQIQTTASKVVVYGSSVATGWVTSRFEKYDHQNGWAARLGRLLTAHGFDFGNVSVPGYSTTTFLKSWDEKIPIEKPDYLIIGLSLGNEGIRGKNPDSVYIHFADGIKAILEKCKENGITPLLGSCYSNNMYDSVQYTFTKRMNVYLNTLMVPMFNFLGAVDDGFGHFPEESYFDPAHPNNLGHEEMFYTIVPSIFRSIELEKQVPRRVPNAGYLEIHPNSGSEGIFYIPDEVVHPFSVSFAFKTAGTGTLYECISDSKISSIMINDAGELVYLSSIGDSVLYSGKINDGNNHRVTISHHYVNGEASFYVDGNFVGKVHERIEPMCVAIAQPGIGTRQGLTQETSIAELFIYRSALCTEEVLALERGKMIHASLEVYSTLECIAGSTKFLNLAQSESELFSSLKDTLESKTNPAGKIASIRRKIHSAHLERDSAIVFPEPAPHTVLEKILNEYSGTYKNEAGDVILISIEAGALYISVNGSKSKLTPISDHEFYIVTPFLNSTYFYRNEETTKEEVVFTFLKTTIKAEKVLE